MYPDVPGSCTIQDLTPPTSSIHSPRNAAANEGIPSSNLHAVISQELGPFPKVLSLGVLRLMEEFLHQLRLVAYPIIYWVLAPSQVVVWDFFHQQCFPSTFSHFFTCQKPSNSKSKRFDPTFSVPQFRSEGLFQGIGKSCFSSPTFLTQRVCRNIQ